MISATCEQCGNAHDYAPWLAGMRVQCKGCKAWLNVPRPEGSKVPTPAAVVAPAPPPPARPALSPPPPAPVQSWRESVANASAEAEGRPTDTTLLGWLNELRAVGATPGEMETELTERGCPRAYAGQFVARYLRGDVRVQLSVRELAATLSIVGLDGLTENEFREEVRKGGRFVIYHHSYAFIVYASKQPSAIHFVRSSESRSQVGWPFTLRSLLFGWWSPHGIIFTIWCVWLNSRGGTDVTPQVLDAFGWRG